jgi:hypothetical protein
MGLITLAQAKQHLRPPGNIDDERISRMIEEATAITLDFIKEPMDAFQASDGTPVEVPGTVRSACLMILDALYDNADGTKNPLSPAVIALLEMHRMPTVA